MCVCVCVCVCVNAEGHLPITNKTTLEHSANAILELEGSFVKIWFFIYATASSFFLKKGHLFNNTHLCQFPCHLGILPENKYRSINATGMN